MALTFSTNIAPYALGRRVNMEEWNTITRTLEGATPVGFGAPVQRGTGDHGCAPYTNGDILGITEANQVLPHTNDEYQQYDNVAICESGVIGAEVSGAVSAGDEAAWNGTAKKWVVSSTDYAAIPGAYFETSGTDTVVALRYRRNVVAS
jgi:hypothetical protein